MFQNLASVTADALNIAINRNIMMSQDDRMSAQTFSPHYEDNSSIDDGLLTLPIPTEGRSVFMRNEGNTAWVSTVLSDGDSTLRSELASQSSGAPGTSLVGHYNSVAGSSTLQSFLDTYMLPVDDTSDIVQNPVDNTKTGRIDVSGLGTGERGIIYVSSTANNFPKTGDIRWNPYDNTPNSGEILVQDGTIGNASSNGTIRANADTESLFTLIWDNAADDLCPIFNSSGTKVARGASASADYANDRQIHIGNFIGRTPTVLGTPIYYTDFTANAANDTCTPTNYWTTLGGNLESGDPITFTTTGTLPAPLATATTYYFVDNSGTSANTFKVATTLANAIAETPTVVNITDTGTGTHTVNKTFGTTLNVGGFTGKDARSESWGNIAPHGHELLVFDAGAFNSPGSFGGYVSKAGTLAESSDTGDGDAYNLYQPTMGMYAFIKL